MTRLVKYNELPNYSCARECQKQQGDSADRGHETARSSERSGNENSRRMQRLWCASGRPAHSKLFCIWRGFRAVENMSMKAVVVEQPGSSSQLKYKDVPVPEIEKGEVKSGLY